MSRKARKDDGSFDLEVLRTLDSLSLDDAREKSVMMLQSSNTKPEKKAALIRDINSANNSAGVCGIMWRTYLAGNGMSVTGSQWQKDFR